MNYQKLIKSVDIFADPQGALNTLYKLSHAIADLADQLAAQQPEATATISSYRLTAMAIREFAEQLADEHNLVPYRPTKAARRRFITD